MKTLNSIARYIKVEFKESKVWIEDGFVLVTLPLRSGNPDWKATFDYLIEQFEKDSDIRSWKGVFVVDQGKQVSDYFGFEFTFYQK